MATKIEKRLGERVAAYRRSSRLTQEKLAEKVGVAPETISRLERAVTVPSIVTLGNIAKALNLELSDFFEHKADRSAKDKALDALCRDLKRREVREIEYIHEFAKKFFQFVGGKRAIK